MKSRLTLTFCLAMAAFTTLLFTSGQAGASFRAGAPNTGSNLQSPSLPIIPSGDWPMYGRDFSRTNYNPDETTLSSSNVAQWVSRWQVNIGSNGTPPSGAPSVSNGKVFVGSSVAAGNDYFAFDAISGSPVWSTTLNYTSSCFNVGIGSTAAISGTALSVGGGDSAFYGLDANNGGQLWRNPMNVGSSGFPWESPLLANGRSYLGMASRCDNPSIRGEVRAVDINTGSQQANQYFVPSGTAGGGIWNSPALSPDGSTLVVVTGEDYSCSPNCADTRAMISLDPITLSILQVNQQGSSGMDQDFGTTPVIFSDNLGRTLVGANHKNGTFYTYVLNNINGGPIWSRATGTNVGMMPAYDPSFGSGGTLFISGGSSLFAVDPATNANRWSPVTVGTMHGNMAIANGLIYMNTGTTGLKIYNESTGALLRTIVPASAGSANSGVVVSHGFVYWLSGSFINAWSLQGTPTPTVTGTPPTPTQTSTPSPTPCGSNGSYNITQSTGSAIVPGTTDTGNHTDDGATTINLPFAYSLYGTSFTTASVTSNGQLDFQTADTGFTNTCLPDTAASYAIFPHWDDLRTDSTGGGIFTSVSGVSPNRIFNVEWRTIYFGTSNVANFEVRLYEGQSRFDLVYGQVDQGGTSATVGVQKDTGSLFTQFECNTGGLSSGLQLTFAQPPCGTTTPTNTPTTIATFTPTNTRTNTPTNTLTNTPTNTPTDTPTSTSTYTPTNTPTVTPTITSGVAQPVLVGHVTWQSRPQPDPRSAIPITLTLRLQAGGPSYEFTGMTTDANGVFTVTVVSLPSGAYYWRVKDPKYLATSGIVTLTGALVTNIEMGLQPTGDASDNNVVDASDFSILRGTFGKSQGQPGYDDRADFNGDLVVNSTDFSLLKANFGHAGAPPIAPTGMH
jgi:hypothetical protein